MMLMFKQRPEISAVHQKLAKVQAEVRHLYDGCYQRGQVTEAEAAKLAQFEATFAELRRSIGGDIEECRKLLGSRLMTSADYLEHLKLVVEPEGMLPVDIVEVLNLRCPIYGGRKKVHQTHLLVWIPNDITLSKLSDAVGGQAGKVLWSDWFIKHDSGLGEKHLAQGHWALIPDRCPPGTKSREGKNFSDSQAALKAEYKDYQQSDVPSLATALVLYERKTKERLYAKELAWCSRELWRASGAALDVGRFDAYGLHVDNVDPECVNTWRGCAACWNFVA